MRLLLPNMNNDIWTGIYGQQHTKELLQRIITSNRIPHAFLFSGPEGVGKYLTAIRFAQALNSNPTDNVTSENIAHKIAHHSEPYLKFIMPLPRGKNETSDNTSLEKLSKEQLDLLKEETDKKISNPYYHIYLENANNIKISSIREIRKFLSMNFDEVKYRIILISEAHLMNDEAQNALLKNLEEPPEGAIFILLTSNRNLLLDTIISRCWSVNFEPLSTEDIISILTRNFSIDEGTSKSLALFSNGSVYKALDFLKHDFDSFKSRVINILRYSIASKFHSAYKEIQPLISDSSGQSLKLVIQLIIFWFVDVQKNKHQIQDYFFWEDSETVEKFNLKFSNIDINNIVVNLSNIEQSVDYNVNLNILALNIIFELASLRFNRI